MIDDKEIDIAARAQALSKHINETTYFQLRSIEDFKDGAKWAINEFLKALWHPAEEKPKKGCVFLYKTIFDGYGLNQIIDGNEWEYIIKYQKATQWLYIDDLISKEGDDSRRIRKA